MLVLVMEELLILELLSLDATVYITIDISNVRSWRRR